MTLVSTAQPILFPGLTPISGGAAVLIAGATIDASGEYDGFVFIAKENMTISEIGIRIQSASGGSVDYEVRVETVDATSGLPTGTLWATDTYANSAAPLSAGTWYLDSLVADASVTTGQAVAIIWKFKTATSFAISRGAYYGSVSHAGLPTRVVNTGTPGKSTTAVSFVAAIGSSTTAFYHIDNVYPIASITARTASTASLDAFGVEFQLPFKCRAVGCQYQGRNATPGGLSVGIYDGSGNEVSSSSTAFDKDYLSAPSAGQVFALRFDNTVTLDANTTYRLAFWPDSATVIQLGTLDTPSADYSEAMLGGLTWHYVTKALAGAWASATTTSFPVVDLIIDQIDDGTGSGGGGGSTGVIGS